ncbi:MAG: hypothetical protein HY716_17385 [Planctomycetes bacterium]|nr:hypothetical protein [Planctomycetota bacterium]
MDKHFEEDDPMVLSGVALPGDTEESMALVFIEELIKMGASDEAVLDVFREPFYAAAHAVLRNHGEPYLRERIARTRAQWGGFRHRGKGAEVENA